MSELNPDWERRSRIEHVQHMRLEDIRQMKELNIIASCQPLHLWADGPWCEEKIGKERLKGTYPFNSLIKAGVKVCFGSDWTVVPLNVIDGIYSAVTRFVEGNEEGEGWIPEEKISVREAVDCYTINAAYASFEEDKKGSIKEGKLADFVVLNKNIFEIPPEDINSTEVDLTIFDGKIIYKNN
jgi:predicted amidohydrolase YtcJ